MPTKNKHSQQATKPTKRAKKTPTIKKMDQKRDFISNKGTDSPTTAKLSEENTFALCKEQKLSFRELCLEAARVFIEGCIVTPDLNHRSLLLNLSSRIGDLSFFLHDREQEHLQRKVDFRAKEVFLVLCAAAKACDTDLATAVMLKMEVNKAKYPAQVCKGSLVKHTSHSDMTGVTKEGNVLVTTCAISERSKPALLATTEQVMQVIQQFSHERHWDDCYTLRNLAFALCVELGELMEIFQWKEDDDSIDQLTLQEKCHAASEFADVMVFLLRLMHLCEADIEKAMLEFFNVWKITDCAQDHSDLTIAN